MLGAHRTPDITQQLLKEYLVYDHVTGVFTWIKRTGWRSKNTPGKRAGTVSNAYRRIKIFGDFQWEHRLAWIYIFGDCAPEHIDHIDGNGMNNVISNLRAYTPSQNQANMKRPITNSSGYKGVFLDARRPVAVWRAAIVHQSKRYHLGTFKSPEMAHAAYAKASAALFGEFARPQG